MVLCRVCAELRGVVRGEHPRRASKMGGLFDFSESVDVSDAVLTSRECAEMPEKTLLIIIQVTATHDSRYL